MGNGDEGHGVLSLKAVFSLAFVQCKESTPNMPKMQFKFTPISQIEQIENNNLIGSLSLDTWTSHWLLKSQATFTTCACT